MAQGIMQKVTNDSGTLYCKMPDGTLIQWGVDGGYQSTKVQSGEGFHLPTAEGAESGCRDTF